MDLERLDRWCERGILGLILAILVFSPLALGAVRHSEFVIVQGLVIAAVALWCLRLWINPRSHLWLPPVCWAVLLFVAYAAGRYYFSDIEYVARQELIRVLVYAFVFFVIVGNLTRQEHAQTVTLVLIGLASLLSVYAICQIVTGNYNVWHFERPPQYAGRASGSFINPNHLASFLAMILPFGLAYTLIGRVGHAVKVVTGYASVLILAGIGVTLSRGGWIAALLSLLVFFGVLMTQRQFRLRAAIMLGVLFAMGAVALSKTDQWQKRFEMAIDEQGIADSRPEIWKPAVAIWRENPVWGAGPGHFDYVYRQHRAPRQQRRPVYVHNDYLQALADWGTVGTGLIFLTLGILGWGVLKSWPHVKRTPNDFGAKLSNKSTIVLGGATGLLAVMLHCVVEFNMQIPSNAILAVTLMAFLSVYWRFATERHWVTPGVVSRLLLTMLLAGGAGYLGWQGWRVGSERAALRVAAKEAPASPERLEALKRAFEAEPSNFQTAYEIGEVYRLRSWEGYTGYKELAAEAMAWFERAMGLNPHDPYSPLRYGMCLVWLDRFDEGARYFERALSLDPNGYFVVAHQGWLAFQLEDYARAREWFQRSLELRRNPMATEYLQLIRAVESRPPFPQISP